MSFMCLSRNLGLLNSLLSLFRTTCMREDGRIAKTSKCYHFVPLVSSLILCFSVTYISNIVSLVLIYTEVTTEIFIILQNIKISCCIWKMLAVMLKIYLVAHISRAYIYLRSQFVELFISRKCQVKVTVEWVEYADIYSSFLECFPLYSAKSFQQDLTSHWVSVETVGELSSFSACFLFHCLQWCCHMSPVGIIAIWFITPPKNSSASCLL